MTTRWKNKMFTAERLAQILLAILMVATALVILLHRPAHNDIAVKNTYLPRDTIGIAATDSTVYDTPAEAPKTSNRRKSTKAKKKTDIPAKQRDHLREPMTVTKEE